MVTTNKGGMGSAASFETNLADTNENQFFCHSCHRVFVLVNPSLDYSCPYCHSSFLEELTARERNSELIPYRRRSQGQLTLDQARRIANATAMLRLLETQLREELEHLQHAFEAASSNYEARNRKSNFTRIMKSHLRNMPITLDHLCGQPSCPICSEDFSVGEVLTRLPCSHLFHPNCVLPWLEHKQNCPICRSDLPNTAPSMEYLENFSTEELLDKLQDLGIEVVDRSKQRDQLIPLLHEKLLDASQKDSLEAVDSTVPVINFTFRTFTPLVLPPASIGMQIRTLYDENATSDN